MLPVKHVYARTPLSNTANANYINLIPPYKQVKTIAKKNSKVSRPVTERARNGRYLKNTKI